MDPITASIDEIAAEYAESFINGNRKFIIGEICNLPIAEAIAVSANVTLRLPTTELQQNFVRLTEVFS